LSVIVPALEEAEALPATLARARAGAIHELIVVDGGSRDATRALATPFADRVLTTERGRARQMNSGAAAATGDVLLFLHADTALPAGFERAIAAALADARVVGGRFDVRLEGASPGLRVVAAAINLRSRLTRIATGDQAIFARRAVFDALGGYPEIPLLEDVSFTRALKRAGRIACLRETVVTSARRWESRGVVRTVVLMWTLRLGYALGASPARLLRFYRDVR
jgi:rSAM/selenodomain-associated transferase 2